LTSSAGNFRAGYSPGAAVYCLLLEHGSITILFII